MKIMVKWLNFLVVLVFILGQPLSAAASPVLADAPASQLSQPKVNPTALAQAAGRLPQVKYSQSFGEFQVPYYDEPTHLNFPGGISVDGDRVWIAEFTGKRALLYNPDGTFVKQINRSMMYLEFVLAEIPYLCDIAVAPDHTLWLNFQGTTVNVDADGAFIRYTSGDEAHQMSYNCKGLAVDGAGRLFVSDWSSHFINVYDSSGVYLQTIGSAGGDPLQFSTPVNIAVDSGYLYVAETGNNRIQILDVSNLADIQYVAAIQEFQMGGFLEQLNDPSGVSVDANRIFVADSGNHRVLVFDRTSRAYLSSIGGAQGTLDDQWNNPYDIAVDASGRVYVSDKNNHRVKQYDSSLALQRIYGETGVAYNTDDKHFVYPNRIQADHLGDVYVSETRAHRVVKLTPQGVPIFSLGESGILGDDTSHFNNPSGLAVDSSNRLYVADQQNHRIMIFDSNGQYVSTFGSQGPDNDQLNFPIGIAIDPTNDDIFVADAGNQRVQVFDQNWTYKTTIGVTGQEGSDNFHFKNMEDLAVDSAGNVYVADNGNARVQKCSPSGDAYACTTFAGETGVKGEPFYHFQNVQGLAVDANDLVYMVDVGMCVVMVYTSQGDFAGSLGGFLLPADITIASPGNVYVSDSMNQRIVKFTPADLGWSQVNLDRFGDSHLDGAPVLVPFNNRLYAGYAHSDGAQVWSMDAADVWQKEADAGSLGLLNQYFSSGVVYQGNLYMGTVNTINAPAGGQLLRYDGANWTNAASPGFSDPANAAISALAEFNGYLYAGTSRADWTVEPPSPLGAQIWRSLTGDAGWAKVWDFGAQGLPANVAIRLLLIYDNALFALVDNSQTGSEIWRSLDGAAWDLVIGNGLGLGSILTISTAEPFGGYLYLGTGVRGQAAQLWRCQSCDSPLDFQRIMQGGFNQADLNRDGRIDNSSITDLQNFQGILHAWTNNAAHGSETWRSLNGISWEAYNPLGLGQWADAYAIATVFNNTLYAGSNSTAVWKFNPIPGDMQDGSVDTGQMRSVTATFEKLADTVTLTLNKLGDGAGLVTSSPAGIFCGSACQHSFPSGSVVTLTPQAQLGSFAGWSGACSGTGACQLTLAADTTVAATFSHHAPSVSNFARGGVVNTDLFFTPADFGANFTDPDRDRLMRVRIVTLPSQGSLKLKGNPVSAGNQIAYDALAGLYYQPDGGFSGEDSFTWSGSDGLFFASPAATAALSIMPDLDGDGIGDGAEANVPPLNEGGLPGDGNGDGLVDTDQPNVTSLAYLPGGASLISGDALKPALRSASASGSYLSMEIPAPLAFVDAVAMVYPPGNPPLPGDKLSFPFGFVEFTIKNITPGAAVDVILYVNGASLADHLLGYGAEEGDVKFHWYDFAFAGQSGAVVEKLPNNRLKITLHYIDGGRGDDDLTANGMIKSVFGVANEPRMVYLPAVRR